MNWTKKTGITGLTLLIIGTGLTVCAQAEDANGQIAELQEELKNARRQINDLEEELFIATDGAQLEEEEEAAQVAEGTDPWTQSIRRIPIGILFPTTSTIEKGSFYGRFSHVSQQQLFTADGDHAFHDFLGLDDGVKIGIMFGYGITDNWDVTVQRTNGRDYFGGDYKTHSFDLWDFMTKVKLLDEQEQFVDLSLTGGATFFWEDDNSGEWAGNAAILVEKSILGFRVGTGLLYSSLSTWEPTGSTQVGGDSPKLYPKEQPWKVPRPAEHTTAIPLSVSVALTKKLYGFGELAFPVDGYETGRGPSAAAGLRYVSPSHAYSLFLCNTSNNGFNSTFTGGYKEDRLDVFGFDISIFF